jgi:hypothetical protein
MPDTKFCACDHMGEVPDALKNLPESQAGPWRHRCAACAYLAGVRDGKKEAVRRLQKHLRAIDMLSEDELVPEIVEIT